MQDLYQNGFRVYIACITFIIRLEGVELLEIAIECLKLDAIISPSKFISRRELPK